MLAGLKYHRLLLKLSGEALASAERSIDSKKLKIIVAEIKALRRLGVELALVVGGGNIWRKRDQGQGMDPATADYLGLLATVMNSLALKQALEKSKVPVVVQSAVAYDIPLAEVVNQGRARRALAKGKVIIFAGGTGKIGFTTDTAAARVAALIKAEVLVKTGPVDGVYTADPRKVRQARKFSTLTIKEARARKLKVMDKQAFAICAKKKIPIVVCRWQKGNVIKVVKGKPVGTEVTV